MAVSSIIQECSCDVKANNPASAIQKKAHAKNKGLFLCAAIVRSYGCLGVSYVDMWIRMKMRLFASWQKSVKELKSSCRSIPQIHILFSLDPRAPLNGMEGALQRYESHIGAKLCTDNTFAVGHMEEVYRLSAYKGSMVDKC
uniref:Uncharacterized protein n=1 Tax=Tanacetum cinerariifolium TaxID=118510 RepID=A0A699J556_TANCI|nr:hypothetical protein [Tanacetum cinerariifolium]